MLERLLKLLPPPATPKAVDFTKAETALKLSLPKDYLEFMARYGGGNLCDFIHLWGEDFLVQSESHLWILRALKHTKIPHPLHPKKGGLLPFGRSDNSDILMWLTAGPPDRWKVIVTDCADFYPTELGFGDFVTRFVEGKLDCGAFPPDAAQTKKFYPYD